MNKKQKTISSYKFLIICWLTFFTISGCASKGIDFYEQLNVSMKNFDNGPIVSRVDAAGGWQSTGLKVTTNVIIKFKSEGTWKVDKNNIVDADGAFTPGYVGNPPVVTVKPNALVGRIGKGRPFLVGKTATITIPNSGLLYLRCNDWGVFDNYGSIDVTMIKQSKTGILPIQNIKLPSLSIESDLLNTQSWALIIGISKYQYSGQNGLSNLIFADDDAKAFARSLRNLGWSESHIKFLTNEEATQRNIMIALESWLSKAGPNDQIILFWAGHGFPDPEDPEKVYFACYDTDISIPATGYRMDKVRTALEERKSKNVILLADTCHAGKLITRGDGSRGLSIVPKINKMAREQKVPKGWIFMVGADTDRQAIEHTSWTNGAFTHSLLKGLNGEADGFQSAGAKDGVVTMGELKDYMKTSMPDETQKVLGVAKHPVITTSTGDPDIWNLTLQVNQ